MKKMLTLLLIAGLLVLGAFAAAEEISEDSFEDLSFTDEYIGDDFGNPTPCEGGGNGDGGIPG